MSGGTVLVLAHREEQAGRTAVLAQQALETNRRTIVVLQGPARAAYAALNGPGERLPFWRSQGKGQAVQRAVTHHHLTGPLLVVDGDLVLPEAAILLHLEAVEAGAWTRPIWTAGRVGRLIPGLLDAYGMTGWLSGRTTPAERRDLSCGGWLGGLVGIPDPGRADLLDTDTGYGWDLDLALRCIAAGLPLEGIPLARRTHEPQGSDHVDRLLRAQLRVLRRWTTDRHLRQHLRAVG